MKRISSFIIAIITLISLTIPAFADSSDYISDPELKAEYQRQMAEYDRLKAEKEALTNQFHKDNTGVREYILTPSSFSSELYYDIVDDALGFRTWYTGYHGSGYYKAGGRVTVYANYSSYNAIQLLPDPKPQVTKTYLEKIAEINKKMNEVSEAAENAAIESMNQDAKMLQKITNRFWIDNDYNNHALLVFQIGNYMYAAGKANRTDFSQGNIVDNNRNAVPYITNGHTMIPIRCLIEGLGGTVDWDPTLNGARCTLNGITIVMPIGSEYAYVNGAPVKMTTPAIVSNGRTMIPVRFVAENLGYDVDWISDGSFVVIKESRKPIGVDYNYDEKLMTYKEEQYYYYLNETTTDYMSCDGLLYSVTLSFDDIIPSEYTDVTEQWRSEGINLPSQFRVYKYEGLRWYDVMIVMSGHSMKVTFHASYEYYCEDELTESQKDNAERAAKVIADTITPVYE